MRKYLIIVVGIAILLLLWFANPTFRGQVVTTRVDSGTVAIPPLPQGTATGEPVKDTTNTSPATGKPSTSVDSANPQIVVSSTGRSGLIIPVAGIHGKQLTDTYSAARSGGRVHDAIDIMAPHNSQVLAAADGEIKRFFLSKLGGTTIYQLSGDGRTVYYYAHLDHYATGIAEGMHVKQGQLIGYVGDTGDAGPGNYHLHFAIWQITDTTKFWDGNNLNPYPLLKDIP